MSSDARNGPHASHDPGGGHCHHHAHGDDAAANAVVDPVCGMRVDPRKAAGSHEHEGVRYYFFGTLCLIRFRADPAKYLQPKTAP